MKWILNRSSLVVPENVTIFRDRTGILLEEKISTQLKDHVKTYKEGSHMKPQGEALEDTKPSNTLILDFWPPGLWENRRLLFKPSSILLEHRQQTNTL